MEGSWAAVTGGREYWLVRYIRYDSLPARVNSRRKGVGVDLSSGLLRTAGFCHET